MTENSSPPGTRLRGSIGVATIVFLVIAAAAPLTAIAGSLPVMIVLGNGAAAPSAYIVTAVVLLLFSVGYAAMSAHMTDTGAFYAYITEGLGRRWGIGAAGLALLTYTAVQAAIYGLAAGTVKDIVVKYGGPDLPWWLWAFALMAAVAVLGYRNIELGAKVLGVLLVLEMGIIIALSVSILIRGGAHGIDFVSFSPSEFMSGSPGIALMFAVGSFVGFEATAIYGEEARNPRKTIPAATYIAVIVIGVMYAIGSWAVVLAFGSDQVVDAAAEDTAGLTFAAATEYLGSTASDVMAIMLITSLFAALLAFHNAVARYTFALARQRVLPVTLSQVHTKHGSPHVGSAVQTISAFVVVAIFALAGADPVLQLFTWMAGEATVSVLILMILTSIAVILYFRRTQVDRRIWHTRIAPVLGSIGIAVILILVLTNFTTLVGGDSTVAWLLLALIVIVFAGGVAWSYRTVDEAGKTKDVEPTHS